jgi:hypothetical protein
MAGRLRKFESKIDTLSRFSRVQAQKNRKISIFERQKRFLRNAYGHHEHFFLIFLSGGIASTVPRKAPMTFVSATLAT